MRSGPKAYEIGTSKRSAALACMYMSAVNNGGINSFLTCTYDYDASEVLAALVAIGALTAAREFEQVLFKLGTPLPASSQDARWSLLERCWSGALDDNDVLTAEADRELMQVLERHVCENEAFYLTLA
jgi:hypothetical protein